MLEENLSQAVDDIYAGRHQQVSPEAMKIIVPMLLRADEGQSPQQIAKELNIEPQQVRELVIRARAWDLSEPVRYRYINSE